MQLKTDQPPCQLMRPRRINNRVETDTYFSLYWLYNDKYIILYLNIVANTLHSSVNGLLMECMCLWTRPTSQGGSLVSGSTLSCKTEVWCWQAQFSYILRTQMLLNLHQYSHDRMSQLLLKLYCLLLLLTWHCG